MLRQALREGCVRPQIAFAASRLSPGSQDDLATIYQQEGELSSADVKRLGGGDAEPDGARPAADGDPDGSRTRASRQLDDDEDPATRARRQAEELLRTLEQTEVADELRRQVAEVVEQLGRIAVLV